jgi:hypothetical protein
VASPTQLNATEQDTLVKQIGLALLRAAPRDWQRVTAEYRALGRYHELTGEVVLSDGSTHEWVATHDIATLFGRLRAGMYREGRGTWFNARYQLDHPSSYNLEYDREEPRWDLAPPAQAYADELRMFPRSEENVPEWLLRRMSGLGPERPGPRFRMARIFDGAGPNGRPMLNRPELDVDEQDRLLDYLDRAPVVLPGRGFDIDRLGSDHDGTVPIAFHSDGEWIWPAAVNYYLREYNVSPEPDLVEHIRAKGFAVPDVPEHARQAAAAHITRGAAPGRQQPPPPGPAEPAPTLHAAEPVRDHVEPPPAVRDEHDGPHTEVVDEGYHHEFGSPEERQDHGQRYDLAAGRSRSNLHEVDESHFDEQLLDEQLADEQLTEEQQHDETDRDWQERHEPEPEQPDHDGVRHDRDLPPYERDAYERGYETVRTESEPDESPDTSTHGAGAYAADGYSADDFNADGYGADGYGADTPGGATPDGGTRDLGAHTFSSHELADDDTAGHGAVVQDIPHDPVRHDAGTPGEPAGLSGAHNAESADDDHTSFSPGPLIEPGPMTTMTPAAVAAAGAGEGRRDSGVDRATAERPPVAQRDDEPPTRFAPPVPRTEHSEPALQDLAAKLHELGVPASAYRIGEPAEHGWCIEQVAAGWRVGWYDGALTSPAMFGDPEDAAAFMLGKLLLAPGGRAAEQQRTPEQAPGGPQRQPEPEPPEQTMVTTLSPATMGGAHPAPQAPAPQPPVPPGAAPAAREPANGAHRVGAPPVPPPPPAPGRPVPAAAQGAPAPRREEPGRPSAPERERAAGSGQGQGQQWPIQPLSGEPPLTLFRGKEMQTLPAGSELDRFGGPSGNLTYAAGTPFEERSLVPEWVNRPYHVYRVQRPLEALHGVAIPWFNQPGGGAAYLLPASIEELVAEGDLIELDPGEPPID